MDSDGDPVVSLNSATRVHCGLPPNPDEVKSTVPDIMVDSCILRHPADLSGDSVYAVMHDGERFFDQAAVAPEELYKSVKFVAKLDTAHIAGSHASGKRMGGWGITRLQCRPTPRQLVLCHFLPLHE